MLALMALSTGVPLHNWDNVQPDSVIVNGILRERLNLYAVVLRFPASPIPLRTLQAAMMVNGVST